MGRCRHRPLHFRFNGSIDTLKLIISKDKSIIDSYMKKYPRSEDLSAFNQRYAFFQNEDGKRFTFAPVLRPLVTLWYEKARFGVLFSTKCALRHGKRCLTP